MTERNRVLSRRSLIRTVSGLTTIAIAGCTGLPFDLPPPRLFVLTPKSTFAKNLPAVDWQLTVESPIAPASLNTSRIAVQRTPISLDYYQGSNWVDTAPKMVQRLLIESFENTHRIVGVGRQSIALRADYNLVTELREFQAELGEGNVPVIRVRLNAKLVRFPQRIIVATASREAVIRAKGPRIEDVVRAFDDALGKVLKEIVTWTLEAVPPKSPSG